MPTKPIPPTEDLDAPQEGAPPGLDRLVQVQIVAEGLSFYGSEGGKPIRVVVSGFISAGDLGPTRHGMLNAAHVLASDSMRIIEQRFNALPSAQRVIVTDVTDVGQAVGGLADEVLGDEA